MGAAKHCLLRGKFKRHFGFCLALSWISCSSGSQPPCCEDTQAAPWGDTCTTELRHLSQKPALTHQPCEWSKMEVEPLSPLQPSDDCSPRDQSQNDAAKLLWVPDSPKLCEIINVYHCFKLVNFGVICGVSELFESLCSGFQFPEFFVTCIHICMF